jgi:hypothetical protein
MVRGTARRDRGGRFQDRTLEPVARRTAEVTSDGRGDGGARVARGVYFVSVRGASGEAARSVVRY